MISRTVLPSFLAILKWPSAAWEPWVSSVIEMLSGLSFPQLPDLGRKPERVIIFIQTDSKRSENSYQHYNKIQTGPHTCKVFVQAKSYPFKKHFYCEQNCKHEIDNLQNEFKLLVVLKVDIFKAKWKAVNRNILLLYSDKLNFESHLDAKMSNRTVHSKKGLSTMSWTTDRKK